MTHYQSGSSTEGYLKGSKSLASSPLPPPPPPPTQSVQCAWAVGEKTQDTRHTRHTAHTIAAVMASHSKQQQRRVWALWAAVVLVSAAMYTAPLAPQAEAACANHCGGHGDCDTEHLVKCSCYDGFDGADCTLSMSCYCVCIVSHLTAWSPLTLWSHHAVPGLCPTGRSWADEATGVDVAHARHQPCSDRGTCDYATGTCKCQAGFEGRACQRSTTCFARICKSLAFPS